MIQCEECEFCTFGPDGRPRLLCDPFRNVKEPACLLKWQLLRLETMVDAYTSTAEMQRRLAPLQEKMFRHVERELDDAQEADSWKRSLEDHEDDEDRPDDWPR